MRTNIEAAPYRSRNNKNIAYLYDNLVIKKNPHDSVFITCYIIISKHAK